MLNGRRLVITTWNDLQICMRDIFASSFYRKELYLEF